LLAASPNFDRVFDCGDAAALSEGAMDEAALADTSWQDQMKATGPARTQEFAQRLVAPHKLTLVDDEGRLAKPAQSRT
jgi:hypothetical protein